MSNHRDDLMYSGENAMLRSLFQIAKDAGLKVEIFNEPPKPLMPVCVLIHHQGELLIMEHFDCTWNALVWLAKQLNDFNSWR